MARIRSVHPTLMSDEAYMSMSMAAKAGWPTLWTQCDDHGIFEWKPVMLKARLFPVDNVDMEAILDEYVSLGCVKRVELDGKSCGVVRNFCKWQRPKHPTYRYKDISGLEEFIGLKRAHSGSPTVGLPQLSPSPPEMSSQRKEGVGVGEEPSSTVEPNPVSEELDDAARAVGAAERHPKIEGRYAFEAGVIRLVRRDLERWQDTFKNLDVQAELTGLSDWAGREHREKWFHPVQGALTKRNRDQGAALVRARAEAEFRAAGTRRPPSAYVV